MISASQIHGVRHTREQEYLAGWQRARAELLNLRQRLAGQQQEENMRQRAQAVQPLLAVADHFRTLTGHVPAALQPDPWTQGVLHIAREFDRLLAEQGIEVINPRHEAFDPSRHEAVEQVAGEQSDTVVEVVRVGYRLGDKILRPAKVRVGK